MKNAVKGQSSKSSTSINFYQFLNKYFFLLFGVTYLSIVTVSTISWDHLCPTNSSSGKSISPNSWDNTVLVPENSHKSSTWFYTIVILGCSGIPWLLAYIFRHKAFSIAKKNFHRYPSVSKTQTLKQKLISTTVLSTSKITNSHKSAPSYRISASKSSSKMRTSLSHNTKNIRLPFERLK